jgi:hypothetical protein
MQNVIYDVDRLLLLYTLAKNVYVYIYSAV